MRAPLPLTPDALAGLAPAAGSTCHRCGSTTRALANGRGRLEICSPCGVVDLRTHEGIEVLRLLASGELGEVRANLRTMRIR